MVKQLVYVRGVWLGFAETREQADRMKLEFFERQRKVDSLRSRLEKEQRVPPTWYQRVDE